MRRQFVCGVLVLFSCVASHAQGGASQSVLNANTAAESELLPLPHVTPALAKAIVQA